MIRVEEAEKIIQSNIKHYGVEIIPFEEAMGRVLSEDIVADRDLPPYNRATMDGIAVKFSAVAGGVSSFFVKATLAAGDAPIEIDAEDECVEIMTGAALPATTDAVIPYEQVTLAGGFAHINPGLAVRQWQNAHLRAKDKKQGEVLVAAGCFIHAPAVNIAAAVGKTTLAVKKLPKVVVVSTGNELVAVDETPNTYQIRGSNSYLIKAAIEEYRLNIELLHLPDEPNTIKQQLQSCLAEYDVIILTGGVSMGKFDYVPLALEELQVVKFFHKVQQRPGKPFWFGGHAGGALVFAFPGNPVSSFLCLQRYFTPWLAMCLGAPQPKTVATLAEDVVFTPALQYFLPVALAFTDAGLLAAKPLTGKGSGDFAGLAGANAFMELPLQRNEFKTGEVFRVWPFKKMF